MTFVEQQEGDLVEPTELSFWVNDKDKVFFQMQPKGNTDAYAYQYMVLGRTDVENMIVELQRILDEYEVND